jgi:hypothetical protein
LILSAAGWLLALGLVAGLLAWPMARSEAILLDGRQRVEGRWVVRAGDALVFVDGMATIEVTGGPSMDDGRPVDVLMREMAGATVRISVWEGSARWVEPRRDLAVRLERGWVRSFRDGEVVERGTTHAVEPSG